MKRKILGFVVIGFAAAVLLNVSAQAKETKPQMSQEMQTQMVKAKVVGTPGPSHEVLNAFEGKWKVTSRSWMKPGDKPEISSGTSSLSWMLDGRFLQQKYKGEWAGEKFNGMGFVGYDNLKKEYVTLWMDNMSTGVFQAKGKYNPATKTINDSGTFSCPMTGEKEKWFRSEWKVVDKNQHVYMMYMKDPNGKEFKSMELTYNRK